MGHLLTREVYVPYNPEAVKVFLQVVLGTKTQGYACLGFLKTIERTFSEKFYAWPSECSEMVRDAGAMNYSGYNVYFCPQLLSRHARRKDTVKAAPNAWSDLDTCPPDLLKVQPSIVLESSPGRYQALWCLEQVAEPLVAEDISRRIAYYHASDGADRSGWDLSQLLRIPTTTNYKHKSKPEVLVRHVENIKYEYDVFDCYPEVVGAAELDIPMPTADDLPQEDAADILQSVRRKLNPYAFGLLEVEPVDDWSKALWKLLLFCFEAGLTREQTFVVAAHAKCNKYARDGRPPICLWRDVCRAYVYHDAKANAFAPKTNLVPILNDTENAGDETFIERYVDWASGLGDAAKQYHQAGGFVILSSLLSGNVILPTSFGTIVPNLWFMLMADTTLTRKSTAMDIAMDLLMEVDPDALLATDGSIEGLFQSLALRPGRPSVFLRDEFSGLLEMMTKRDYYAGMAETLTKLYDGKNQKRVLRREIITVNRPVLVLFAGGIKTKIQALLTTEHVSSGFIPRFVFLTAESDVEKVQPLGPPTVSGWGRRQELQDEMLEIHEHYAPKRGSAQRATEAVLTSDAWMRYNELEKLMLEQGLESNRPDLMTPVYARLTISTLKAAVLIAASRQRDEKVTVHECDIVRAIRYGDDWRSYAADVINGIGATVLERKIQRILDSITAAPGISRSNLMRKHNLTSQSARIVFDTLEDRGLITTGKFGRNTVYYPSIGA